MMPTPPADDEMSLREIARTLSDFRNEFRNQITQLLRADVYRAEQAAVMARIATLEKDRDQAETDRKSTHRLAIGSGLAALGSFVVGLILFAITHH